MKLAISNIAWSENNDEAVYALMHKYGFSGLEIAPTRIFPEKPYADCTRASAWADRLRTQEGFVVPSMQSIWFGRTEKLFGTGDERKTLLDYTFRAIDFAESMGCQNLVFGCPKNRIKPDGVSEDPVCDFFKTIGDYAFAHGAYICIEANPTIYGTNYINTTKQAFELVKKLDTQGLRVNLDIGTLIANEEKMEDIMAYSGLISHVHISEPFLKPIEKRALHCELASWLSDTGYEGWISIEMGRQDDMHEIERVMMDVTSAIGCGC